MHETLLPNLCFRIFHLGRQLELSSLASCNQLFFKASSVIIACCDDNSSFPFQLDLSLPCPVVDVILLVPAFSDFRYYLQFVLSFLLLLLKELFSIYVALNLKISRRFIAGFQVLLVQAFNVLVNVSFELVVKA